MNLRSVLTRVLSRSVRVLTIAAIGLLIGACSSSDSSSADADSADPTTVEPGEVPVIDEPVVELEPEEFTPPASVTANLYETLLANGMFTRALELYERAGITDSLEGTEPMTLFAPTDAAFTELDLAIGAGVVDTFTAAELADRLQYHSIPGNALNSEALRAIAGQAVDTGNGLPAAISLGDNNELMINSATLTLTDIVTSNGILHVIDAVLTPPARITDPNENIPAPTTVDISTSLLTQPDYSILLNLIERAGMAELLQEDNGGLGWTLFAVPDSAFESSEEDVFGLDMDGAMLLVQRHLYPGTLGTADMQEGELFMSAGSVDIVIDAETGLRTVGGAIIVGRDRVVGNGIIHYVDRPLVSTGS